MDWNDPAKTKVDGPDRRSPWRRTTISAAVSSRNCVPQPGTERRLDAQGDKIMARLVYRRIGDRESIVAVHSVNTSAGARRRALVRVPARPQNAQRRRCISRARTRRTASTAGWPARRSIGSATSASAIRSAARRISRPAIRGATAPTIRSGSLTLRETVLVEGEGVADDHASRWEDYTQTAIDPTDDCTIWYVGDYFKKDATSYSTRIGAFRMPGCR